MRRSLLSSKMLKLWQTTGVVRPPLKNGIWPRLGDRVLVRVALFRHSIDENELILSARSVRFHSGEGVISGCERTARNRPAFIS